MLGTLDIFSMRLQEKCNDERRDRRTYVVGTHLEDKKHTLKVILGVCINTIILINIMIIEKLVWTSLYL